MDFRQPMGRLYLPHGLYMTVFLAMENGPFIDGLVKNGDFLQLWMTEYDRSLSVVYPHFFGWQGFILVMKIHPFPTRYFVLGLTVIGCM